VRRKAILIGVAAVLVLILAIGIWQFHISRPSIEPASVEKMAFPLPDKPSFAVLPFANMSDDSELEYLSDGFTETLIAALSNMPGMFVIARSSTFKYKGKPVTIKQVAEELGVHYVIEGSFQKSGDKLRVTTQMIDALTGFHIWSEQYDRNFKEIFKIQDDITLNIIKSAGSKYDKYKAIDPYSIKQVAGTNNLDAYLKDLNGFHMWRNNPNPETISKVKRLSEEAIALDPNFLHAYFGLIGMIIQEARYGLSKSFENSMERALKLAQKTVEIDELSSRAHTEMGQVLYNLKEHDKAVAELEQAISLNPENHYAYYYLGWTLNYAGRGQEAISAFKKGIRTNPWGRIYNLFGIGAANALMGKYEAAIPYIQESIELLGKPNYIFHLWLAACYAALGREEEAKAESQEVLRLHKTFSLNKYINRLPAKDPESIRRYVVALRKTGLPE
jgi:adenylate cyclase